MKKLFLLGLCLFFFANANAQVVSLHQEEKTALRKLLTEDPEAEVIWTKMLKGADEALMATPNPADTILTEGILQGHPRKTKTWKSLEDMDKVYNLSLAYVVNGDKRYLKKALSFVVAWAKINQPIGNPINDTNLDQMIFAYDLIKSESPKVENRLVIKWLRQVALAEKESYNKVLGGRSKTHFNNWNSHRIKVVAQIAWTIDDDSLKTWVKAAYERQIGKNLLPDGSSHDFHERDALHYHVYDVDPLLVTATILDRDHADVTHIDPYGYQSPSGSSLKKSIDWLVPFFTGEKTHAEWVNSKSAFDRKRAANGEKGYLAGTLFKPAEARTSIALAAYFEPQLLGLYQQQINNKLKYPTWQFVLNKVKKRIQNQ